MPNLFSISTTIGRWCKGQLFFFFKEYTHLKDEVSLEST